MTDTVVEIPISGHAFGQSSPAGSSPHPFRAGWSETFLAGPENFLIVEAVKSVFNGQFPPFYNPLVLHGPPGVGKTHLAAGMADTWRRIRGPRSAIHAMALDFARQWTEASETRTTDEFRARYRRPELLAIDDLDALADRPAAQDELLHTIDALLSAGSQVVVTAREAPGEIAGLLPALKARLISGLVVRVAPPGREVRLAAARKFAVLGGLDLSQEAAQALVDGLPEPLSAIWAAIGYLRMSGSIEPSKSLDRRVAELLAERKRNEPSLREIARAVARHFSVRLTDLRSGCRRRAVVTARDVAMYLARTLTGKSFEQIGAYFGGRDHSTVSHGCTKTAQLLKADAILRRAFDQLWRQLDGRAVDPLPTTSAGQFAERPHPSPTQPVASRSATGSEF